MNRLGLVASKCRVMLPVAIRRKLRLSHGSKLHVHFDGREGEQVLSTLLIIPELSERAGRSIKLGLHPQPAWTSITRHTELQECSD